MKRVALVLSLLASSCGGGGGSSSVAPASAAPPQAITATFQPSQTPSGPGVVVDGPSSPQQGSITLDFVASSISNPTYGAAFDLDFDPSLVSFDSFQNGSFFEPGGKVNYQVAKAPGNPGKLIVGVSLLGSSNGASGNGRILSIRFSIQNTVGTSALTFAGNNLLDPNGQIIPNVSWSAGTIQTRR